MFLLSRTIKNASFSLRYKAIQLSHGILFGLRYRTEQAFNMQKIEQLESLLTTQRKEKILRQSFSLEHALKIAQRLALAEERADIVTDLLSAFQTEEVVSIRFPSCKVSI